jgi:hypothetical protein
MCNEQLVATQDCFDVSKTRGSLLPKQFSALISTENNLVSTNKKRNYCRKCKHRNDLQIKKEQSTQEHALQHQ